MARFLVITLEKHVHEPTLAPSATRSLIEARASYEQQLRAASVYLDGERLRPSSEGCRVSRLRGQTRVEMGPFDDKGMTGYYAVEAESLDSAIKLTEHCPLPPNAELEVRPLMRGSIEPDKGKKRGRVFAFAVLGSAPNEQGWVDVMNRIDGSSRHDFPVEGLLGGLRLQPPGTGRRVASTGGRRAVFDGPFLEGKEVIGGLFFVRMASLEEAAHWASLTQFVDHGSVEIRELWRS